MSAKHTPGPWFADSNGDVWRRSPADLYQNGGGVAGDRPLAAANKGWFGEAETGYPVEANARLIAAAPELYEALEGMLQVYGGKYDNDCLPKNSVELDLIDMARAAIAKATGEQP